MKILTTLQIIFLFVIVVAIGTIIYVKEVVNTGELTIESSKDINKTIEVCNKTDMFKSADCVEKTTNKFFFYNESKIGINMDFDTLLKEGGVCSHWADYYCYIGKEMGYFTTRVVMKTVRNQTDSLGHVICIWSNKDGYVILDQTSAENFYLA